MLMNLSAFGIISCVMLMFLNLDKATLEKWGDLRGFNVSKKMIIHANYSNFRKNDHSAISRRFGHDHRYAYDGSDYDNCNGTINVLLHSRTGIKITCDILILKEDATVKNIPFKARYTSPNTCVNKSSFRDEEKGISEKGISEKDSFLSESTIHLSQAPPPPPPAHLLCRTLPLNHENLLERMRRILPSSPGELNIIFLVTKGLFKFGLFAF